MHHYTDTGEYVQDPSADGLLGMQVPLTTLLSILPSHSLKGKASSKKVKRKVKKLEDTAQDLQDRYAYLHQKVESIAAQSQRVDPSSHLPPKLICLASLEPTGNLRQGPS